MYSKKEIFLDQLQFELGDRWPELDYSSISTINELTDFVLDRQVVSHWPFLSFLTFYTHAATFIEQEKKIAVSSNYDLNNLSKSEKIKFIQFIEASFGKPLVFRRPKKLVKFIFIFPILVILLPMLISTYLITTLNYSGLLYLSGLIGLLLTVGLFKITEPFKNRFSPSSLLEYSKSLFVINNLKQVEAPSREVLIGFLCQSAKSSFQSDFKAETIIPE